MTVRPSRRLYQMEMTSSFVFMHAARCLRICGHCTGHMLYCLALVFHLLVPASKLMLQTALSVMRFTTLCRLGHRAQHDCDPTPQPGGKCPSPLCCCGDVQVDVMFFDIQLAASVIHSNVMIEGMTQMVLQVRSTHGW